MNRNEMNRNNMNRSDSGCHGLQARLSYLRPLVMIGLVSLGLALAGFARSTRNATAPDLPEKYYNVSMTTAKGTLQEDRVTAVRQAGAGAAIDSARLVLLGEPTGVNPDGEASTFWIDSDRGMVSYPIKARDDLESLTDALMLELRVLGFAVTSPTPGVFLFTINELDDGSTFMAGTDDVGLDDSVGMQ